MLDIKTYWHPFSIDDTSKIYIDGAADTIDRFGSNDIYDIKTYWHPFFIDDASNIYIDDATDTIDHFGCNAICVKSGEGLTISGIDREPARYYKSFSSAISVSAKYRRAMLLPKSEIIRTSEFVWKKCEAVKKETLLNSLLMRSQTSFDRFIKEHMQAIEMPFKRIYKPFAENTALKDEKIANAVKHNQDAIASSENFSRLARFAREFSEPMTVAEDYRRLVDLFKRENEISIRSVRIKQTPCGVLSDIVVNNHAITLDEFNRLANKASGYNSFTEFKVGEYEYQDALYRLAVRRKNSASNPLVYDYAIHVDIDDVKDRGTADIPAEETKVYFNRTYYTTPDVVVIVCGGTEGSVVIPSITEQGEDNKGKYFKIILKDATGTVVAGRISWNSNGY
nr:MAG TPA: hypothetical protein [Bacteriophage sp.]